MIYSKIKIVLMKNLNICILAIFLMLFFYSCNSLQVAHMTSSKMNGLELGMSKGQVIDILGTSYTIFEKRMEYNNEIEVLSYRDHYKNDEFYLFVFKNKKVEEGYNR